LMRGYLSTFMISEEVDVTDHADWLRLTANAWLLWRAMKFQDATVVPERLSADL
jgi:hypothetical protein